jgi:hypothetical protein
MTAEQHNILCRLRARIEHAVALRLESSSHRLGKVEGRRQMFGLCLRRRGASPQTRKIRQVRKIVHLTDLLKLVAGKIDAKLGLQPCLLADSVVSNRGGELGPV